MNLTNPQTLFWVAAIQRLFVLFPDPLSSHRETAGSGFISDFQPANKAQHYQLRQFNATASMDEPCFKLCYRLFYLMQRLHVK